MKVSVFGLGYVGSVTAACLASDGHSVVGVDSAARKVEAVQNGRSPVLEPGLDELLARQVAEKRLTATLSATTAVHQSDVSLIAVGTPSTRSGSLSVEALTRVTRTIAEAMRSSSRRHTIVVRSTVLPGTAEETLLPLIEDTSGLTAGEDFGFAVNPEFLREGTAISDFFSAPKTVIGQYDPPSGEVVAMLYAGRPDVMRVSLKAAELAKYVDNAFHAVKVTFANEIGAICRGLDVDANEVMRPFLMDTHLNISTAYLTPGFAFGGSCLPKDLRALLYAASRSDVSVPMLDGVLESNRECVARALRAITTYAPCRVGLFGLAFKSGTDDLRESPYVELAERLLGKGYDLRIYDPAVAVARLSGANREYIQERIPHLSVLLSDCIGDVVRHSQVCVVSGQTKDLARHIGTLTEAPVVDLCALPRAPDTSNEEAQLGVAW